MTRWLMVTGIGALLAIALAWELTAMDAVPDGPVAPPGPVAPAPQAALAPAGADLVGAAASTMLARPLFSPTRRPAAARPSPPPPSPPAEAIPRLAGIVIGPSGRKAIFAEAAGPARSVGEGGRIGRFTVTMIRPGQVTVTSSEGDRVLRPSFTQATPAPGSAVPPAAPPPALPPMIAPPGRSR